MKILLIQLFENNMVEPVYPIGLAYLATILSNHEIMILDQNVCGGDPFDETKKMMRNFYPEIVGISIRNVWLYSKKENNFILYQKSFQPTIKAIKSINNNAIIIVGGTGFSVFPEKIMRFENGIDYGIYLEGEESFKNLIENINFPEKFNGVFVRDKDWVYMKGSYSAPDFGNLPQPRRDFVAPQLYRENYAIGIQTKRGCILRCIYCNYPYLSGGLLRLRKPERVVNEIEDLQSHYSVKEFNFVDNVFNIPITHAEEICREIIRRDLKIYWTAWFNERFMDEDFVDLAIKAGCKTFELTPDGYSSKSLKWLNKNIETKHIIKTYRILKKKKGTEVWYNFILGIPGQGIFSLMRMAFFFLRLKVFMGKKFNRITLHKLGISPNTDLEKIAIRDKIISKETDLFISKETDLFKGYYYEVGIIKWIKKFKLFHSFFKSIKSSISK